MLATLKYTLSRFTVRIRRTFDYSWKGKNIKWPTHILHNKRHCTPRWGSGYLDTETPPTRLSWHSCYTTVISDALDTMLINTIWRRPSESCL